MLSAHQLTCVRGERRLFPCLDLSVGAGEWLYVRGENGAGKTSLLRLLAGLAPPESGEMRWCGEPIGEAGREWRSNLMFLGHHAAVKGELTALENLEFAAALDDGDLPQ